MHAVLTSRARMMFTQNYSKIIQISNILFVDQPYGVVVVVDGAYLPRLRRSRDVRSVLFQIKSDLRKRSVIEFARFVAEIIVNENDIPFVRSARGNAFNIIK